MKNNRPATTCLPMPVFEPFIKTLSLTILNLYFSVLKKGWEVVKVILSNFSLSKKMTNTTSSGFNRSSNEK